MKIPTNMERGNTMVMRILTVIVLGITIMSCGGLSEEEIWLKVQEGQKKSDVKETLQYYQLLIDKYPNSTHISEALWKSASIYSNDLKDFLSAVKYYKAFASRFPDHRDAPTALFLTGFIYNNELKDIDSARVYYTEFMRRYPANEMITSVKFELDHLGKEPDTILPSPKSGTTAKKGR